MKSLQSLVVLSMTILMLSCTEQTSTLTTEPSQTEAKPAPQAEAKPKTKRPDDAVQFNGHWYKIYKGQLSWHEKKKKCEELGGYLACIETEAEQKFIAKLANDEYLSLGATDEAEEGEWKWVNGAPFTYKAWMDGQPNNYGGVENYLATYDYGEWVDVAVEGDDFWMPTGYICEWEE